MPVPKPTYSMRGWNSGPPPCPRQGTGVPGSVEAGPTSACVPLKVLAEADILGSLKASSTANLYP